MFDDIPILAIDPSKRGAWALWNPDTKKVTFGSWNFGDSGIHGEYYARFIAGIEDVLIDHNLDKDFSLRIVIEAPTPNADRSAASLALSEGWIAIVKLWCYRRKLVEPIAVVVNSWRSFFIKGAVKPKGLSKGESRNWLKEQVILVCNSYNIHPSNDNEADAIGILRWMKAGGHERLEKERQRKQREINNKRAQIKLDLGAPA